MISYCYASQSNIGILLVWPVSSLPRCHFGILLVWPVSSLLRCHFGILLVWPVSSSPRCHFGILFFGRRLSSPRCHFGILFCGRCLSLPCCHFGILVWPVFSIAMLPSQHPRLADVQCRHKRRRQLPRHLLSSRPALSIAAPPSLISAGSFIRHATISYLGPHSPRHHLFNWLAHLTAACPYLIFRRLPLPRRPFMAVQPIDCHVM
jgi:hypothetical protein